MKRETFTRSQEPRFSEGPCCAQNDAEATKALVKKHDSSFKERLQGASVMETIECIPLKAGSKPKAKSEGKKKKAVLLSKESH